MSASPFQTILACVSSKSALIGCLASFSGASAYAIICGVLFACGMGLPIPEDITIIASGILAALGKISIWGAFVVCMVGVLAGDGLLFFLGRKLGDNAFNLPIIRKIMTEKRKKLAKEKVLNNSKFICFVARFLPGLRAPTYLTAGAMGVKPSTFILLDGFAALISVPVWIYVGWFIGDKWDESMAIIKKMHMAIIIGIVILAVGYFFVKRYLNNKKAN